MRTERGMMPSDVNQLRGEIEELQVRHVALHSDELFVLWFLIAYLTNEEAGVQALTGSACDRGIDAIHVDDDARTVFVIQGKYRQSSRARESHADVLSFAQLGQDLLGTPDEFHALVDGIAPSVKDRLSRSRERLQKRGYRLELYFVTTGGLSSDLRSQAETRARNAGATFVAIDRSRTLQILDDYLDGVAPPIPSAEIEIARGVEASELRRFDKQTGIESWVFSVRGSTLRALYRQAGIRLFARNIRGFLGNTVVNQAMGTTLTSEPEKFWYYNNGVTMIRAEAEQVAKSGRSFFHVANPQIINGQQTTRVLADSGRAGDATVLVRMIRLPRDQMDLVSKIVAATNSQSHIHPADLMSNDFRQIELDRQLRRFGYFYMRKRMTKGEARRIGGRDIKAFIKKEDLAQAVAACQFDPELARAHKTRIFGESRYYDEVFDSRDVRTYLTIYWLGDAVRRIAWGDRDRGAARWFVLHLLWQRVGPLVKKENRAHTFIAAAEGDVEHNEVLRAVDRSVEQTFRAAERFYRANRGRGREALTMDVFFKRSGQHDRFSDAWDDLPDKQRRDFDNTIAGVQRALDAAQQ